MARQAAPRVWREWYVTEAGGKGIHKLCLRTEGKAKAREKLKTWMAECRREKEEAERLGLVETDKPYTVEEAAALFLQSKVAAKAASTLDYYKRFLTKWKDWYGRQEIRKLRRHDGDQFLTRLVEAGLENTTVNHHVGAAKSVLNYAVECDLLVKNPFRKIPKLPEDKRERIATDEEFQKLLAACEGSIAWQGKVDRNENAQSMKDILHILRFTALRPGELRKLRWDHLHLSGDGPWLIIIPPREHKTGRTAKRPEARMSPVLAEAKAILERRREQYGHQPLVFPNLNGNLASTSSFSKRFAKLRKRAKLDEPDQNGEQLTWYTLRHTRLTEAATKEGWSFFNLMMLAGHTDPKMTRRYVHVQQDDLKRAALEGEQRRLAAKQQPPSS